MSESESIRPDDERLATKMRQAFYDGLARECLDLAWLRLNEFRQNKVMTRRFHGRLREREGVPLSEVANAISRSTGELSRWFAGASPSWGNLSIVMTALSADWPDLQSLPDKLQRRSAGCIAALKEIRRAISGESLLAPTHTTIRSLLALAVDEEWITFRQISDRRDCILNRISESSGISTEELDRADREWGNAFLLWLKAYMDSLDEQVWQ